MGWWARVVAEGGCSFLWSFPTLLDLTTSTSEVRARAAAAAAECWKQRACVRVCVCLA